MSVLRQLERLVQLARPPATGSQEEARSAAMKACQIIRENQLTVWDPRATKSHVTEQIAFGDDMGVRQKYAAAVDANPVRVAMRRRQAERAEADRKRRERERFEVGQHSGGG